MKIYALCFDMRFDTALFYTTRESARRVLNQKHTELFIRGVEFTEDTADFFSYHFGWEERGGTWKIHEINVNE